MKSCDFLFIYEIKPREIESVLLLKKELERRGYTVMIEQMWSLSRRTSQIDAKVVITSSALDDIMFSFVNEIAYRPLKVINLQWEQVLSDFEVEIYYPKIKLNNNLAKNAVHLSWGKINKDRLVSICGVPEKNVKITGNAAMDFLRPEFRSYFKSRNEICEEFGFDKSKEIVLFISSFTFQYTSDELVNGERYKALGYDVLYKTMKEVSTKSQQKMLEWFETVLKNDSRHEFVYRPHPAELSNPDLIEMSEKHDNFHIITNYSVKQWILTADKLYTWYSTSIIEAYFAKKHCMILRPYEVPDRFEIEIYRDAEMIDNYDDFERSFSNDDLCAKNFSEKQFPISSKNFDDYYFKKDDTPTYKIMCDVFEDIYKSDEYIIKEQEKLKKKKYPLKKRIIIYGRKYASVSPLLYFASKLPVIKNGKIASVVNNNRAGRKKYKNGCASKEEIKRINAKISDVFGFDK